MDASVRTVALISSAGIRLVGVPVPPPTEIRITDSIKGARYRHWDAEVRTRQYVRKDDYSYLEREAVATVRR